MTDQIGCLVEASPCSIGYAGRSAASLAINPNTDAIKVNGQSPEALCIQGDVPSSIPGFKYPLSRKLYLSSTPGFAAVNGQELQLAGCETDLAQTLPGGNTPAGLMTTNALTDVTTFGFLNVGALNGGEPYCEDFNENMLCGAATFPTNNNACGQAHANFSNWPGTGPSTTICGNGTKEPYEDCDCGTSTQSTTDTQCPAGQVNGGTFCSTTCRFVQ
jgi:hypothetical protein